MNILNAINEIYENETAFEAMLSNGKHITIFRNSVGGIGTDSKATLTMSKEIVEADWKPVYIVQKIKIDPVFFEDIEKGVKTFELINNDRDYKVGQVLNIGEYENKEFTGRYVKKQVCLNKINGMIVYLVDGIQTIITTIKNNNIAKGFILNDDLTLDKCFVVKRNNLFAHGETLHDANQALNDKLFDNMSKEERIEEFLNEFEIDKKYPVMKFFEWHNRLTGSCEMGRKTFAKNRNIDLEHDELTVCEFIELTKNDYGGEIIKMLEEALKA